MNTYTNAWTIAYFLMLENGWQSWTMGPRPHAYNVYSWGEK